MRPIYIRKDYGNNTRKILIDMAFLSSNKKIRLPKNYFVEGLYLPFKPKNNDGSIERYELTKDKIISEDKNHYFFKFPFKPDQVENVAN